MTGAPWWSSLLAVIAASGASGHDALQPNPPDAVIEQMDRAVLEDLRTRGSSLDREPDQLYALARERVRPNFDLAYTARRVVGPAWQSATEGDRAGFVDAFERYLITSYARALLFVRPGTLTVVGPPQPLEVALAVLPLRVVMQDGTRVEAEVHFRLDGGVWRIWDVRASGISFVRQYRGDFGTEARIHGLAQSTASLERIARRNESELRERLRGTGSIRDAR